MSWVDKISSGLNSAISFFRPKAKPIPPLLLICEINERPGLSAIALTSAIIQRLPEAGIETGPNPDGSPNMVNKLVKIMCEEIVKEIKDNAKINCVVMPSVINSVGTATAPGVPPIPVTTMNTNPCTIDGIII